MKMTNENGRSMVEMLGVLAIIGVLSVGGIAGYTMAMNKYRANEIAAEAAQCGILAVAKASVSTTGLTDVNCTTLMDIQNASYITNMKVTAAKDTDKATVTVTMPADSKITKALQGLAGSVSNFTLVVS